ncbi:hypothetical protein PSPO01_08218 [Paraphaeosphaeria sporulosa]
MKQMRSMDHGSMMRALSAEPPQQLRRCKKPFQYHSGNCGPLDFVEQLRAYADRKSPSGPQAQKQIHLPSATSAVASQNEPADPPGVPAAPPQTTDHEMDALFAAYIEYPEIPTENTRPESSKRSQTLREPSKRRRTTDGPQHTKSSLLPLERVPDKCRIHNILLRLPLRITSIKAAMLKLDMRTNCIEWGYPLDASPYDGLGMSITDVLLRAYVLRIDGMLESFETGLDREDVLRAMESGIRRAFSERADGDDDVGQMEGWIGEGIGSTEAGMNFCDGEFGAVLPERSSVSASELTITHPMCSDRDDDGDFGDGLDDESLMDF